MIVSFPRRWPMVLAALAVTAAACGGPPDPLDVAVKEVPSDIVLGSAASGAAVPAPVPPSVPVLSGPGVPPSLFDPPAFEVPAGSTPPNGPRPTSPTTAPPACPAADPFAVPKREARNDIAEPPPTGPLPYRVDGSFDVSGANARKGRFPVSSTRTVQSVRATANGFTYEVAAELAGTTTTTGYQVIRRSSVPGEAGLYVTFVATKAPSGATARFQPALPVKLVDIPLLAGTSQTAAGTDPASATTVSWTTTVGKKVRVDACGTVLDAISLELTDGRVAGPATDVTFTATYALATQFGGLSVADTVTLQGREGSEQVARKIAATVSADPGRAR